MKNIKILNLVSLTIISILFVCCVKHAKRTFFVSMKESYKDVKIDSDFYFLKSFGISKSGTFINGSEYWNIHSQRVSYFFLSGYIRNDNDSIMFIPFDYHSLTFQKEEKKIFDFDCKINDEWKITYFDKSLFIQGYSIIFKGQVKIDGENDCVFEFHPFRGDGRRDYYIDRLFQLIVSKKRGIISITQFRSTDKKGSVK